MEKIKRTYFVCQIPKSDLQCIPDCRCNLVKAVEERIGSIIKQILPVGGNVVMHDSLGYGESVKTG